jgi:hypothetical protein
MQIEKTLGENSDRDNAAGKNRPHQQAAFLDVVDHASFLVRISTGGKQALA